MSKTVRYAISAAFVLPLLVAACGGDSTLSHAEFVKKGNAICQKVDKKSEALSKTIGPNSKPKEVAAALDKLVPMAKGLTEDLEDLNASDKDADGLDKAIEVQKEQTAEVKRAAKQFRDGDLAAGQASAKSVEAKGPAVDKAFNDIGLTKCGSDSDS